MAQEIVGIKIQVDGGDAGKSVGSLKQQLREAQNDVQVLSEKFGATSKEAIQAAKRAAQLKDAIGDAKALTAAFNPEAKFKALGQALGAVSGGFTAVQGAIGLFGDEAKDLEKQLLKVQSALAITQGIESLSGLGDAFKNVKAVAIDAFKGIKTAIGSTGIGLLVVALGTIYAYWDDIKEAVSGVSEEQKKLNKATKENLDAEQKKLEAIDEQDNILKLQGKSEKEILQIKIKQTDETIQAAEINLQNLKNQRDGQIAIAKRNKDILQGLIALVTSPITAVLGAVDLIGKAVGKNFGLAEGFTGGLAKLVFDPEQVASEADAAISEAEKGLTKLKNQRAGYQLAIKNIDKQAAEDSAKKTFEINQEKLKKQYEDEDKATKTKNVEFLKTEAELDKDKRLIATRGKTQLNFDIKKLNTDAGVDEANRLQAQAKAQDDVNEYLKQRDKERRNAEIANAQDALNIVAGLVDQNSVAGKAIAVVQAIINTYQGASKALAQGGIFGPVAAAATVAAGLIQVKKIISTKIPSAKGTGNVADTGGGGGMTMAAAPISPNAPIQNTVTQLDQTSINKLGSATSRAYVVESDITNSQEKITRINRAARIG